MIRSTLSAHVAAVTADVRRFARREEAYLAGMFQNLGEVLVAHHSPMKLASVRARVDEGRAQDEASIEELGFTFDRLAAAVSGHWKLSPYLTSLWNPGPVSTELTQLARLGHGLTRLMCIHTPAHQEPGLKLLTMSTACRCESRWRASLISGSAPSRTREGRS
jgi:HDOD domain-containing protein